MQKTRAQRLAPIALLSVAVVWGAAFVLMKDAIKAQHIIDFLGTRFCIAAAIMVIAKPRVLRQIPRKLLGQGVFLGVLLAIAYYTQTVGLELSTAAIAGFITGLYVVMSPLLIWLFLKKKVDRRVVYGVIFATVGLGFISINGLNFEVSHLWLVACALFFSLHIVGLAKWSPGQDAYALTVIQLATMGVINMAIALAKGYQPPSGFDGWFAILFTAVFSTAIAFFIQTWAQGIMDSSRVAIFLTTEVVAAAGIAVAIGQEVLQTKTIIGGALMLVAMLVVEWPTKANRSEVPLETFPH